MFSDSKPERDVAMLVFKSSYVIEKISMTLSYSLIFM